MVGASQGVLEHLVGDDGATVSKAKEGVISEDSLDAHSASVEHGLMGQGREGLQGIKIQHFISAATDSFGGCELLDI